MISIPAPLAVTGSAQKLPAVIPSGVCTVTLSNTGSTNVIYIGTTSAVTASGASQGFPLPVGATVSFSGFPGSSGGQLWAVAGGTGNNLGVIISTGS